MMYHNNAPHDHEKGYPARRSEPLESEVTRHFEESIWNEKYRQSNKILFVGYVDVGFQSVQLIRRRTLMHYAGVLKHSPLRYQC